MSRGFVCYHHCNDLDRPVVSTCSRCGKALCAQCTDLLRSKQTGDIVCVECLNNELANHEVRMANAAERMKSEIIRMIVGGVIGLIFATVVLTIIPEMGMLAFWLFPFLFASFGLIWQHSFGSNGWLMGAILFVIMALVSPIMFAWRVYKRVSDRKKLAEGIAFNQRARAGYTKYMQTARTCKSGMSSAEMQDLVLRMERAKKSGNSTEMANLQAQLNELKQKEAADAEELRSLREGQEMLYQDVEDIHKQNNQRNRKD